MKLSELTESVTFSLSEFRKDKDYPDGLYDFTPFYKHEFKPCGFCDGTGKEKWENDHGDPLWHECEYCKGKAATKEWIPMVGELNLANSNARTLLQMLGYEDDELSGAWNPKDLPEVKRRLIKLMNQDTSQHTQQPRRVPGQTRVGKDDNGMSRITRGPLLYDMGRTQNQLDRYMSELWKLVDAAQKLNASVSWA